MLGCPEYASCQDLVSNYYKSRTSWEHDLRRGSFSLRPHKMRKLFVRTIAGSNDACANRTRASSHACCSAGALLMLGTQIGALLGSVGHGAQL